MGSREERVHTQYETWLAGHTPVALYVRWYLRHGGPAMLIRSLPPWAIHASPACSMWAAPQAST